MHFLILVLLSLSLALTPAVKAQEPSSVSAPLQVTASLPPTAQIQQDTPLTISLSRPLCSGSHVTVRVQWHTRPQGEEPTLLVGVPVSMLRFHVSGQYVGTVELGIIAKGICAGAKYQPLTTQEVRVDVLP